MGDRERIEESVQASRVLKDDLEEAGVRGVDLWWNDIENAQRIQQTYQSKNQFMDIEMEGRYAWMLRRGGFDVQMKPYGTKGPDLQISSEGQSIDIEVSRFRSDKSAHDKLRGGGENGGMIHEPWTDDKIYDKIVGKAKQLRDDADGIVLLFSDHEYTGKHDFDRLKGDLADERIPSELPAKLAAAIFTDGFIGYKGYEGDNVQHAMLTNPFASRARMSADELERMMEKIMRCLS